MKTFDPSFIEIGFEDYEIKILAKAGKILHEIVNEMVRNSCSTLEVNDYDDIYTYSIDTIRDMYNKLEDFCSYIPNKMY